MTDMMNKRILLTGFLPFGGETINPAQEIVETIKIDRSDVELHKAILPVSFLQSKKILEELLTEIKPDAVLSLGQSGGCSEIKIERFSINLNDTCKPDNDGDIPFERKIYADGANAYFASIPVKKIVSNIRENGIPSILSNSAGLYVCNNVMYTALHFIESHKLSSKAGFIHVPFLPQQAVTKDKKPSMNLCDMVKAVEIAINTIADDLKSPISDMTIF